VSTELVSVRIWLPDRPGVLGSVASRIGAIDANVVGLEVLERDGGVAIDELMVELPRPGMTEEMSAAVREIEGAGIEDIRPIPSDAEERGLQVMSGAVSILETANSAAALAALMGHVGELFDVEWAALADFEGHRCVHSFGEVPSLDWLRAFCSAANSPAASDGATAGSGVLALELAGPGLTLCLGRGFAFRRRERREIEMLVAITDRILAALDPGLAIHPTW
jgi:hypothetical protein